MGGIGDQICQYIFARFLKRKFNSYNIILDISYYQNKKKPFKLFIDQINQKELNFKKNFFKFNFETIQYLRFIKSKFIINFCFTDKVNYFEYEYWNQQNPNLPNIKNLTYFFGYWHNQNFLSGIDMQIKKELEVFINFKVKKLIKKIKKEHVSVHIRGGDFLKNIHAKNLGVNYYKKSFEFFLKKIKKPIFIIFTNDKLHAKQIIAKTKIKAKFFFINGLKLKDIEEFSLLRHYQNMILSNSTFSWTSALLSKKKICSVAPLQWYKNTKIDKKRYLKNQLIIKNI